MVGGAGGDVAKKPLVSRGLVGWPEKANSWGGRGKEGCQGSARCNWEGRTLEVTKGNPLVVPNKNIAGEWFGKGTGPGLSNEEVLVGKFEPAASKA